MRYSITLLALVATVFAAPVERRQSNSTEISSSNSNQDLNNNLDLNNGQDDSNLDLNNELNLNSLDLSNLNSNELDLNDIDINGILEQLQEQILAEQLLSGNNVNDINELDLNGQNDLQLNNFDLDGFNQLFDSQFSVNSIVELLEGLGSSNILDQNNLQDNNNNLNLEQFAGQFNDQNQASWQANEILALLESISGNQNLQQLEDLAQLSGGLDNNNILNNGNNVVETQLEEISI